MPPERPATLPAGHDRDHLRRPLAQPRRSWRGAPSGASSQGPDRRWRCSTTNISTSLGSMPVGEPIRPLRLVRRVRSLGKGGRNKLWKLPLKRGWMVCWARKSAAETPGDCIRRALRQQMPRYGVDRFRAKWSWTPSISVNSYEECSGHPAFRPLAGRAICMIGPFPRRLQVALLLYGRNRAILGNARDLHHRQNQTLGREGRPAARPHQAQYSWIRALVRRHRSAGIERRAGLALHSESPGASRAHRLFFTSSPLSLLAGQAGRRQVVHHAMVAFEHRFDRARKAGVGVQPRPRTRPCGGHELEQVTRNGASALFWLAQFSSAARTFSTKASCLAA